MYPSFEELKAELKKRKVHLSYQRLKVLEYLAQKKGHPTADQIYTGLQREIPTLSRTTVYNTLKLLTEAGLVRALTIEDNESRYDIMTKDHGHFKCETCGEIYNFSVDMESLAPGGLDHFMIRDRDVYFKGVCERCLSNIEKTE